MGELSAVKPFESEVRFFIPDIEQFRSRIAELGLKLLREYAFTDYYYQPKTNRWESLAQSLRIREWVMPKRPSAILLTKQEVSRVGTFYFKKSIYPEGKRALFTGSTNDCREVLADLGFQEVYKITKKTGFVWQDLERELEFCAEETDIFGWSGELELEGTDPAYIEHRIKRFQELLRVTDDQLSYKPVAVMIEEVLAEKSKKIENIEKKNGKTSQIF